MKSIKFILPIIAVMLLSIGFISFVSAQENDNIIEMPYLQKLFNIFGISTDSSTIKISTYDETSDELVGSIGISPEAVVINKELCLGEECKSEWPQESWSTVDDNITFEGAVGVGPLDKPRAIMDIAGEANTTNPLLVITTQDTGGLNKLNECDSSFEWRDRNDNGMTDEGECDRDIVRVDEDMSVNTDLYVQGDITTNQKLTAGNLEISGSAEISETEINYAQINQLNVKKLNVEESLVENDYTEIRDLKVNNLAVEKINFIDNELRGEYFELIAGIGKEHYLNGKPVSCVGYSGAMQQDILETKTAPIVTTISQCRCKDGYEKKGVADGIHVCILKIKLSEL